MKHVLIHGPMACGKTRNKQKLAKAFGCQNVVDGAALREIKVSVERAAIKTLYLTTDVPAGLDTGRCDVVDFYDAMHKAGLAA